MSIEPMMSCTVEESRMRTGQMSRRRSTIWLLVGWIEARLRETVLAMTLLLQVRDWCVVEPVELCRRNIEHIFKGREECPVCSIVLEISMQTLPNMQKMTAEAG